jgi:hypothetical protein
VEVHPSARKHGVKDADIDHAVEFYLYRDEYEADEPPTRILYLGPNRAGNMLEVVVIEHDDGSELAIHAMKMQPRYWCRVFPGGDHE